MNAYWRYYEEEQIASGVQVKRPELIISGKVNNDYKTIFRGSSPQVLHAGVRPGDELWNTLSNINNGLSFVVGGASESLGKTIHARAEVRNLYGWNKTTGGSLDKVLIKGVPVNRSFLNGTAKTLRIGGPALVVLGVGMTLYEISEGQKSLVGEGGLDLIMGGVAFIPGVVGLFQEHILEVNSYWNILKMIFGMSLKLIGK